MSANSDVCLLKHPFLEANTSLITIKEATKTVANCLEASDSSIMSLLNPFENEMVKGLVENFYLLKNISAAPSLVYHANTLYSAAKASNGELAILTSSPLLGSASALAKFGHEEEIFSNPSITSFLGCSSAVALTGVSLWKGLQSGINTYQLAQEVEIYETLIETSESEEEIEIVRNNTQICKNERNQEALATMSSISWMLLGLMTINELSSGEKLNVPLLTASLSVLAYTANVSSINSQYNEFKEGVSDFLDDYLGGSFFQLD